MLDRTIIQCEQMASTSIPEKLRLLFPSLSDAWIRHLLEDGELISAHQNQSDFDDTDGIHCYIMLDGLLLAENEESSLLLQQGDVFGLRETLFSSNTNGAHPNNEQSQSQGQGQSQSQTNGQVQLMSTSNKTLFIKIKSGVVLKKMESTPQLREDWLHVLNQSFERQLSYGLDLYHLDTLDRVRHLIKKMIRYADERIELPIKQIQMLTGVSRSSIYRCLKTLEMEESLVFCNKGQICIDVHKEMS